MALPYPTELPSKLFRVGVPRHETRLTDALRAEVRGLIRPGPGRQLVLVVEPEMPVGRPDLVVIAVSRRAVEFRRARGLRLSTASEARVLAAAVDPRSPSGLSGGSEREIRGRLADRGWLSANGLPAASVESRVNDSLIVEAKVSNWRRAVSQLARTRDAAHRSAIALPTERLGAVQRPYLKKSGLGLLAVDECGVVTWKRSSPRRPLSLAADLWLVELAIRQNADRH